MRVIGKYLPRIRWNGVLMSWRQWIFGFHNANEWVIWDRYQINIDRNVMGCKKILLLPRWLSDMRPAVDWKVLTSSDYYVIQLIFNRYDLYSGNSVSVAQLTMTRGPNWDPGACGVALVGWTRSRFLRFPSCTMKIILTWRFELARRLVVGRRLVDQGCNFKVWQSLTCVHFFILDSVLGPHY